MNDKSVDHDTFRAFQLMSELEAGEAVSQRELASRLGIAVGLVNSYLRNFVAKGYVRVKAFPRNRYAYLLTPKGFTEKSRLALQHLNYFTGLYTSTRREYLKLFIQMKTLGVDSVIFCGVDEVAEIAYLSLQEAGLELAEVFDTDGERRELFGREIMPLTEIMTKADFSHDLPIVIASLKRQVELYRLLINLGVDQGNIFMVGPFE